MSLYYYGLHCFTCIFTEHLSALLVSQTDLLRVLRLRINRAVLHRCFCNLTFSPYDVFKDFSLSLTFAHWQTSPLSVFHTNLSPPWGLGACCAFCWEHLPWPAPHWLLLLIQAPSSPPTATHPALFLQSRNLLSSPLPAPHRCPSSKDTICLLTAPASGMCRCRAPVRWISWAKEEKGERTERRAERTEDTSG